MPTITCASRWKQLVTKDYRSCSTFVACNLPRRQQSLTRELSIVFCVSEQREVLISRCDFVVLGNTQSIVRVCVLGISETSSRLTTRLRRDSGSSRNITLSAMFVRSFAVMS